MNLLVSFLYLETFNNEIYCDNSSESNYECTMAYGYAYIFFPLLNNNLLLSVINKKIAVKHGIQCEYCTTPEANKYFELLTMLTNNNSKICVS